MIYVFLAVFACYYLFLILVITGWQKAVSFPEPGVGGVPGAFISVVVPFRNEESQLSRLIEDLKRQRYTKYEVILVDDHSNDDSVDIASRAIVGRPDFRILTSNGEGKKRALATGIAAARGPWIATTDADCTIPEVWVERISSFTTDTQAKLLFGAVRIDDRADFFPRLQQLEFSSVLVTGVAANAWNIPLYCNGASIAFRKEAFHEVGGYDDNISIASGDDEFLLKKMAGRFPGGIRFMNQPDSVITTAPLQSLGDFLHQRVRWAGKWRQTGGLASPAIAILVFTLQAVFLSLIGLLFTGWYPRLITFLFAGKLLLEFVVLFNAGTFLRFRIRLIPFFVLQLVYPLYVIVTGVLTGFFQYSWKGRKVRPTAPASSQV